MDFDQQYHGTPDWSFPSPSATPTSGSFGQNIFETPKASGCPTHFQDAFTTPQMQTNATPQQPHHASMTPMQRPLAATGLLHSNVFADGVPSQQSGQAMPGSEHFGHQQNLSTTSPNFAGSPSGVNTSFGSIQVQTPPPTRGASARKPHNAQPVAFGTPSTIASRRFMTPQQVLPSNDPNPSTYGAPSTHVPHLQFSPDMYQFNNLGAASAPVMRQQNIMWGHQSPNQPFLADDPFAPLSQQGNPWSPAAGQIANAQSSSFDTPAMNSFPVQALHPPPPQSIPTSYSGSAHVGSTAGVDPALLYSSPVHPVVRPDSRQSRTRTPALPPQVSRGADVGPGHARTDTLSSGSTVASRTEQPLQRSRTTGASRPRSAHFASGSMEPIIRSHSIQQFPRTASPVKRVGRTPLGSISESKAKQRTSVVLTVDENGRARTETRRIEPSPSRSMRERYPALFDSDSSDAESEVSDATPSKVASFTFDDRDQRRVKAARLDPPIENLEGLTIPRSNSSASMRKGVAPSRAAVAAAAQLRRQGSLRKGSSSRNSSSRRASAVIDSAPMDAPRQPSGQLEEAQRQQAPSQSPSTNEQSVRPSNVENMLAAYNRRWSMMSFEQQHTLNPTGSNQNLNMYNSQTMGTPLPFQSQCMIRCLCGVPSNQGQPLVQCQSCTQWVHSACVGLQGQPYPPAFTCFLCTPPGAGVIPRT